MPEREPRLRIVCLVSGGGRTVVNLHQRIAAGRLDAAITRVIASREDCAAVERLRGLGLEVAVVPHEPGVHRGEYGKRVWREILAGEPGLVCLCGFVHFLPIPAKWEGRVMNIHPALLPAFGGKGMYGAKVHEAVLAAGVKISGCTVHFADNEYDHGPIVVQRAVPVREGDTPTSLAARVFEAECEAYPEAITLFAQGRLAIEGRIVRVR
jgi:phosphoribosylglycinamide formyltransferase-1